MAKDKNHVLVKEYLNNHSLVESNIRSFNNFVGKRMQEIVTELSDALPNEDFEINLGKITVGKPNIVEADGSSKPISPAEARLRKLTYSAPVKMEMTINYAGQVETEDVQLGRIPIMIKSNSCNLADLNEEELIKNYIDPKDQGGYFLINGNERVMVMAEDLASNQTFVEWQKAKNRLMLRLFSQRGAYKIPVSLVESPDGILEISFSRFRDIPAIVLLKALGMTSDADIVNLIGKQTDSLVVNLYEYADIANINDALTYYAINEMQSGKSMASAIEEATNLINNDFQIEDTYLIPKKYNGQPINADDVATKANRIKDIELAKFNAVPFGSFLDIPEAERQKEFNSQLVENGRWVNTADGTGLMFVIVLADGSFAPIENSNGENLQFNFNDTDMIIPTTDIDISAPKDETRFERIGRERRAERALKNKRDIRY